jgi:oligopeptide/dipeptide ABC transporter ATP-binding protein
VSTLLEVRSLRIRFPSAQGPVCPVDGVDFAVARGETLALVGESGSGKSLSSLALLQLVPSPGTIDPASSARLGDIDLLTLRGEALRQVRGRRIGMVFQDPAASLNPVLTVGDQISETIRAHLPLSGAEARQRTLALLAEVGLGDDPSRFGSYPHQLSGGMRQRVMIAIALAAEPELLIADEPTSALDVTVQAQILSLLDQLKQTRGMAMLLITHDLGVVAGRADRMAVMYAGQIVEEGPAGLLFRRPSHPYTRGLLASLPRLDGPRVPLAPIGGTVPVPGAWPVGCRFHPRCPEAMAICTSAPPVRVTGDGQCARCWLGDPAAAGSPRRSGRAIP